MKKKSQKRKRGKAHSLPQHGDWRLIGLRSGPIRPEAATGGPCGAGWPHPAISSSLVGVMPPHCNDNVTSCAFVHTHAPGAARAAGIEAVWELDGGRGRKWGLAPAVCRPCCGGMDAAISTDRFERRHAAGWRVGAAMGRGHLCCCHFGRRLCLYSGQWLYSTAPCTALHGACRVAPARPLRRS